MRCRCGGHGSHNGKRRSRFTDAVRLDVRAERTLELVAVEDQRDAVTARLALNEAGARAVGTVYEFDTE